MASKRDQFLTACRNAKLDTVRWGLGAGGQNPGTRDDDGYTAIMITARSNKHKALQMLLDNCRRARMREPIDYVDGQGDEETALMMAAREGHREACDELLYAGANAKMKCARGMTAADHARKAGHDALARRIDRGGDSSEEEEESASEDEGGIEGETSTQRSKRKKKELEALERRGEKKIGKGKGQDEDDGDDSDDGERGGKAPEPKWPETAQAMESQAKEVAIIRDKKDVEVDPALFYVKSVNNLKLNLGVSFVKLSPDISRLSGLLTLIISGNGLIELPESIGKLKNLKVLEAENNKLTALPKSLADCKNLEILRVSRNKIKSLAPLEHANNLVTLVADDNKLTTLDDFNVEAKSRIVTLSARMNQIEEAPADIHQCTLLAEIFLKQNKIEDLPGEWGELKEKKVREIELEGNPIADPKVRKMMDKSANFVKELLTYLRKNGKKSAGKKKKLAKVVDDDDEEDEAPAPAAAAPASKTQPKAEVQADDETESENEEELEARMAKMNKKEREKFKRKLAEERQAKAAKEAERKRREQDAAARARLEAAKHMHEEEDVDGESDIDSDDEMAILARKKGKKPAGFLYAMTDEQRAEAEKVEADRLLKIELAKQAEEDAKKAAEERVALELAAKVSGVKLTGEGVYGWQYTGGQFKSIKVPALPKGAKGPCVELEIPKIIVGKLIGAKGATIKEVQDRSKAMVSIDETKGASGNSLLRVRGDESAMESARMLMNNALAGKRR
ncbi:hypothetical protein BE221DRAFT_189699 [Ostreococcus tauri]|uniref:K Homology domain-containing protein n=1 Tax=Ostreococcus tauri TaxID=70448 RepID=A0A1Y5IFQ7_OSTTA|nr:hypothetical protein BE221DRAFT_189699 [Ostreococcus tauri]